VQAAAELDLMREAASKVGNGFGTFGSAVSDRLADAKRNADEAAKAMSDVDRATQDVAKAQNDLELAVGKYGPTSDDARSKSEALARAQAILAAEQDKVALATTGVTQAMRAQADQAAAAADSSLAYRMSVDATEDAVAALSAAQASGTATADELDDASMAVEQALLRQAAAAQQSAIDLNSHKGEAQAAAEGDAAFLAELLNLQATMGASFPAALNTTISRLQGATNAGMVAAAQFAQLGLNVLAVPDSKTIIVSSTTPEQIALLESLGFKVETLPDGTVRVTAQTAEAENAIAQVTRDRTVTVRVRTVGGVHISGPGGGGTITEFAATGGAIEGGRVQHFDGGGAVRGPGGPRQDLVPAMLSNGEHVWNSAEVNAAGGQSAVAAMRRSVLSGREFSGGGSGSSGGTVTVRIDGARLVGTLDLGGGLEGRIEGVVVSALTTATNQGRYH
jgi:hypothetical protein